MTVVDPSADPAWYGADASFRARLENELRAVTGFDGPARSELHADRLAFDLAALVVPGDVERHDVRIEFRRPKLQPWWSYGIAPCDQPAVFTSSTRPVLHDNRGDGLCMWTPFDPPEHRWRQEDGMLVLVEITRRHLFLNLHWWRTGGHHGGVWLGPATAHGVPHEWVAQTDFSGADFSGRRMRHAALSGALLASADLSGADLSGANLSGANLSGADLTGADLTDADLTRAVFDATTTWPDGFTPPSED